MARKSGFQNYEEMRVKILNTTYEMIKKFGITHTSIEKITKACGMGKGTFYRYYPSKEMLIYALIQKQAANSLRHFQSQLNGREKMTAEEGKEYIKFIINREDTVYRHLTRDYLHRLEEAIPEKAEDIRPGNRADTISMLLSRIEGVRDDVDIPLIAELIKVYSVAFLHWDDELLLPPKAEIGSVVYPHLFSLIFNEE